MNSTIHITPIDNVENHHVRDNDLVEIRTYNSDLDVFTLENKKSGKRRKSNLMGASLYEDYMVSDSGVKFFMLYMVTR